VNLYKAMGGIWVTDAERMTATMYGTNGGPVTLDACTPAGGEGTVP
jgi:multidrug efflux system outer membrane protein